MGCMSPVYPPFSGIIGYKGIVSPGVAGNGIPGGVPIHG